MTSLAVAAALLGDAMLYVVMPSRPELWHLTIAQVGILLSANRFVRLLTNPMSSEIIRRFGVGKPFASAMWSSLIVLIIYAYSTNFLVLLLARLLWGACWSVLRLGAQWTALEHSSKFNLGLNLSYNASIIRIGAIGGALFGGILSDYVGYREALLIFGLSTLVVTGIWSKKTLKQISKLTIQKEQQRRQYKNILGNPRIMVINCCALVVGLIWAGILSGTIGHYLRFRYGLELNFFTIALGVTSFTGLVLGLRSFAEVFVGPMGGYLSDRYGRVRVLLITLIFSAGCVMGLGVNLNVFNMLILLILAFAGGVLLNMQLLALAGEIAQKISRTETLSVYATFQDFGSALGPLIGLSLIASAHLSLLYETSGIILLIFGLIFFVAFRRVSFESTSITSI
jgi:MFS family permease